MSEYNEICSVPNTTAASEFAFDKSTAVEYNVSSIMKDTPYILNIETLEIPPEQDIEEGEPFFGQNIREAARVLRGILR